MSPDNTDACDAWGTPKTAAGPDNIQPRLGEAVGKKASYLFWNWTSSVEPRSAVVETSPPVTVTCTWSK